MLEITKMLIAVKKNKFTALLFIYNFRHTLLTPTARTLGELAKISREVLHGIN